MGYAHRASLTDAELVAARWRVTSQATTLP
jgi:hypothetical protein